MKSRGRLECGGSTEVEEHRLLLVTTFSMTRSAGRYAGPRIRYVRSPTSGDPRVVQRRAEMSSIASVSVNSDSCLKMLIRQRAKR